MNDDQPLEIEDFLPMPQDPRILVMVKPADRPSFLALWALASRLTKLLEDAREPLIGQIKLAWWRDMLTLLEQDAQAIPKGEPLLAELTQYWRGQAGLGRLVDAAEALLLAEDDQTRHDAGADFGAHLFHFSARCLNPQEAATSTAAPKGAIGERWGLLWAACLCRGSDGASALMAAAGAAPAPRAKHIGRPARALLMLDRLAGRVAAANGARDHRQEGLILLRIGLIGR